MKTIDITFLHTADVHVKTFSRLIEKSNVSVSVKHIVNSDLLEIDLTDLVKGLAQHSQWVVCTCSTLGGLAEKIKRENGHNVIRIDRAMADMAVNSGFKILVLAALPSTLVPTQLLIQSSQQLQGTENSIDYCVVDGSWDYFIANQQALYLQTIATKIEQKQSQYDCIVLAQASMAGAISLINKKGPLILSSPEIGVNALLKKLVEQAI